jgi:hypothetical protein
MQQYCILTVKIIYFCTTKFNLDIYEIYIQNKP